jgi:GNAT superfamily N-acetyltransferase
VAEAMVTQLGRDEVGVAADLIARAFHDDALTVHLYPDERARSRLAPLMFRALVRYDCLFGQVDRLAGWEAVAAWVRPGGAGESPERLKEAGFDELPEDIPLDRLDAFFGVVGQAHERAAPGPHWYLRLLGVDPDHQGGGLGSALLRHGLERSDADGRSCYLETFSERTVPFYLRHGFDLVAEDVEPATGIRYWCFRRSPRG